VIRKLDIIGNDILENFIVDMRVLNANLPCFFKINIVTIAKIENPSAQKHVSAKKEIISIRFSFYALQGSTQRFALPALGRGRRSRPTRKILRRRKLPGMCAESPASGARFVGLRFCEIRWL